MVQLITLGPEHRALLTDLMEEWLASGEDIVPYAIRKRDHRDFDAYLEGLGQDRLGQDGFVPATTLFGWDPQQNLLVGAVNIRHFLNDSLLHSGGHIGDGVRPSQRRRGYATQMIAQALDFCRGMGMDRVLMTCDRENIPSAKSIKNNGGVLENEVEKDGRLIERYWITL